MNSERYYKWIAFEYEQNISKLLNSVEGQGLINRLRINYKLALIPSDEPGMIFAKGFHYLISGQNKLDELVKAIRKEGSNLKRVIYIGNNLDIIREVGHSISSNKGVRALAYLDKQTPKELEKLIVQAEKAKSKG